MSEGSNLDVRIGLCSFTIRIDTSFEEGSNATRRSCLRGVRGIAERFQTMHLSSTTSFYNQDVTNYLREGRWDLDA